MEVLDVYKELPKGILNWYDFSENERMLLLGNNDATILELLKLKTNSLHHVSLDKVTMNEFIKNNEKYFDYIVLLNQLEEVKKPIQFLKDIKTLLKPNGKLLIGMDNRLGLRYFCGDRDPFTQRNFDGVENYRRAEDKTGHYIKGRNYAKHEIKEFLEKSGFSNNKFYSVLPNMKFPQLIYSEHIVPKEELGIRLFPRYNSPDTVFLEEEYLYTDIIKSGMFHQMANSYLIECPLEDNFVNIDFVTLSLDRGKENAMATIIRNNGLVEKKCLYKEGQARIKALYENTQKLKKRKLDVIDVKLKGNVCESDYCGDELALNTFKRLAKNDVEAFEVKLDAFINQIYKSSEYRIENDEVILENGFIDMVPLNCFYKNDRFVFFDQEFCIKDYPVKAIIYRVIEIIFSSNIGNDNYLSREYFFEKYELNAKLEYWHKITSEFIVELRNIIKLNAFMEKYSTDYQVLNTNRQKVNYSLSDYKKRFIDIFNDIEDKELVIFGSGNFSSRFIAQFKSQWNISFIVDNNKNNWGGQLEEINILSPEKINELNPEKIKVIICVKNYLPIIFQLNSIGVKNYAIYDPNIEYPRKNKVCKNLKDGNYKAVKPYKIGYIAGVFDLFHIGHLNLLKRAKDKCEHLIVGVVSDEGVRKFKNVELFIPAVERVQMLEACRYVDEVVEIPFYFRGTRDAYNMYQFDCMFSGSDYQNDPIWLADREYLRRQGSDMIFLPYTETTSSSKIKTKINKSIK